MIHLKFRLFVPQNFPVGIQPMGPGTEHKAGRLAVAVAFKPDASINVKQQTIPEMGFQLLLIPAAAYSSGKIRGVGGHGKALLKIQLGL